MLYTSPLFCFLKKCSYFCTFFLSFNEESENDRPFSRVNGILFVTIIRQYCLFVVLRHGHNGLVLSGGYPFTDFLVTGKDCFDG